MPLDLPGRVVSLRRNFSESVKCATQYHSLSVPNCMFILNLPDPLPNCYAGLISLVCDSLAYPDPLPTLTATGGGGRVWEHTIQRLVQQHPKKGTQLSHSNACGSQWRHGHGQVAGLLFMLVRLLLARSAYRSPTKNNFTSLTKSRNILFSPSQMWCWYHTVYCKLAGMW